MPNNSLILVVNTGSSSLKFGVYSEGGVQFETTISDEDSFGECEDSQPSCKAPSRISDLSTLKELLYVVKQRFPTFNIKAVGHRIVHGGVGFTEATTLTPKIHAQLENLTPFAGMHQSRNLAGVSIMRSLLPEIPQIGCFDTAFHTTMPKQERMLGLPLLYFQTGIMRFGFHGLSYESIVQLLPGIDERAAKGRTVICHLGSGCSLCGVFGGKSVATTMSCTPLDGLVMSTRAGSIDPGVILYLLRNECKTPDQIEHLLTKESGLLGLSGISGDVRKLLQNSALPAREALDLFCYRIAREIGAMSAALQGIDAIVFTGGVGENSPQIRASICSQLGWLGVTMSSIQNDSSARELHSSDSRVSILRIPSNENAIIFKHTLATIQSKYN